MCARACVCAIFNIAFELVSAVRENRMQPWCLHYCTATISLWCYTAASSARHNANNTQLSSMPPIHPIIRPTVAVAAGCISDCESHLCIEYQFPYKYRVSAHIATSVSVGGLPCTRAHTSQPPHQRRHNRTRNRRTSITTVTLRDHTHAHIVYRIVRNTLIHTHTSADYMHTRFESKHIIK